MRNRIGQCVGILGVAAALTACFDDGGDSNAVSLKSEQDVMREISNVIALQGGAGSPAPSPASRTTGYRALAERSGGSGGPKRPRETFLCDAGSVEITEHFDSARPYRLLGTAYATDYLVSEYDECVTNDGDTSVTETGRFEDGDNSAHRTGEDPELGYIRAGSGDTGFRIVNEGGNIRFSARFLGRGETRDDATTHESRDAMEFDFALSLSGQTTRASMDIGENDDPFIVHVDFGGAPQTVSIDGPIRYSSDFCDGGRVRYDTVTPLTFGEDGNGTFINGGELIIDAGRRSVTLVFHANGDVDYEFDNGTSGTITRAEQLAGEGAECLP